MPTILRFVVVLAALSKLQGQPMVRDFGATGDGVTDDSAAFARAIHSMEGAGGALRISKGTYNLGKTGIVIPKTLGGIRLIGDSATSTILTYSGSGAAVQVGAADGFTYGHTISDLRIDIGGAEATAVGVRLYPSLYVGLIRLYVTSSNIFAPEVNQQVGIEAIGGNRDNKLFGAYLRIEDARIDGRFKKGIYFTAGQLNWGYNSCILQGGAIVYSGDPAEGTVGIHIEQGNTNVITLVDVEQFETGIKSEAYANSFIGSRTEGNRVGLVLAGEADGSTGGSYNRVVGGFHSDGIKDRSHASQIIATLGAADVAATSSTSRKRAGSN